MGSMPEAGSCMKTDKYNRMARTSRKTGGMPAGNMIRWRRDAAKPNALDILASCKQDAMVSAAARIRTQSLPLQGTGLPSDQQADRECVAAAVLLALVPQECSKKPDTPHLSKHPWPPENRIGV
jgi:hypothetical protein